MHFNVSKINQCIFPSSYRYSRGISQRGPVYPSTHIHPKPLPLKTHSPLFIHGEDTQGPEKENKQINNEKKNPITFGVIPTQPI